MITAWHSRPDKIFCLISLVANIVAVILIPLWFKYSAWFMSDTNCVTNVDWNNKNWRPCVLKLRLHERCVFINHTLVHCDHWDHLGVTIHLIHIPMQTEKIPSEQTAEDAEHTIAALFFCLFSSIIYTFGNCARTFTTVVNSVLVSILLYTLISIWIQLADAIVDHRPAASLYLLLFTVVEVYYGGLALMISRMIYVYHRKETEKHYVSVPERDPEMVEMTQGQPLTEAAPKRQQEDLEVAEEESIDTTEVEGS